MKFLYKAFFCVAIGLLGINIAGFYISLRPAGVDDPKLMPVPATLSVAEVYGVQKRTDLPREAYLVQLNEAVRQGTAHFWPDSEWDRFHVRVPITENYLLHLAGVLFPDRFGKYEFVDYHKGLERGLGLCSQRSIILVGLLEEKGIPAHVIGLYGHVVSEAQDSNGKWWILDPDYGVELPYSLETLQANPELVRNYYPADEADNMVEYYGPERNFRANSIYEYGKKGYILEKASYLFIWLIPLGLAAPQGWLWLRRMGNFQRKPSRKRF